MFTSWLSRRPDFFGKGPVRLAVFGAADLGNKYSKDPP